MIACLHNNKSKSELPSQRAGESLHRGRGESERARAADDHDGDGEQQREQRGVVVELGRVEPRARDAAGARQRVPHSEGGGREHQHDWREGAGDLHTASQSVSQSATQSVSVSPVSHIVSQ